MQYEKVPYDVYKRISSPNVIGVCTKTVVTLSSVAAPLRGIVEAAV